MADKTSQKMTAQKLRIVLLISIVAFLAVGVAGVVFARSGLESYAVDVQKSTAIAESSSKNVLTLQKLKTQLSEDKDAVERAKELVADSKSFAYQDQIIKDLNTYATKSGVQISSYTFNSEAAAPGASAPSSSTAAPSATGSAASPVSTTNLKTISVSINLKSPMKYESLMTFIHYLETNLTKMQLAGVSIIKDPTSGNVTASSLTVEVYVK